MESYRELIVWKKSRKFVVDIYKLTEKFPKAELFGLTSQMRRAAVSIPANIAEGYCRKHRPEYIQFLRIAYGSGAELETYCGLTTDLGYVQKEKSVELEASLAEIMRMLNRLIASLTIKH